MEFVSHAVLELAALRRFPGNARRGNLEVIAASLARFGQYRSLIVRAQGEAWQIIAGNHTFDAITLLCSMSEAGLRQAYGADAAARWVAADPVARCEVIACGDDEARRINLADNRTAELGEYDDDALAVMLASLGGDYAGTGWAEEDLAGLLPPEPGLTGPDDAPPVPADPVTRPGDLWLLGPHRLACADATDPAAMGLLLGGQVADCMWTDPPYGVEVVGGSRAVPAAERRKAGKLQLQGDHAGGLPALLDGIFGAASDLVREGGAVYVAYPGHHRHVFDAAFNRAGWTYAQELIWVKGHVFGRNDYHYAHEGIIFGYTSGAAIRRNIRPGWWGGNDQNTVFDIPRPARSDEHPSMKPAELVARHLHNSCPPAGLVYDPCAGSGSTLIAAHQLHMRASCAEIDPAYCDVIVRRWAEFTGAEPHREPNGVKVASMATEPA